MSITWGSIDTDRDRRAYAQAKTELGTNAPIRDLLQRAQEIKQLLSERSNQDDGTEGS